MKTTKSLAALGLFGKAAVLGALIMSVSACVYDTNPEPHHAGYYSNGYYSYYDYPSDYHYYHDRYYDECSAYHGNDCEYRDDRDSLNHTHDMNFHNRDDYDHYDH